MPDQVKTSSGAIWNPVLGILGLALLLLILGIANIRPRTTSCSNPCINNLRQIEAAKDQYSLENDLSNMSVVTWADIGPTNTPTGGYLKAWPACPESKSKLPRSQARTEHDYRINPIGSNAACIHFGHRHVLR